MSDSTKRHDDSSVNTVSRREILKSASVASASVVGFSGTGVASPSTKVIEDSPRIGQGQFVDVGIEYEINDLGKEYDKLRDYHKFHDCAHPKYDVDKQRVVIYKEFVPSVERNKVQQEDGIVAGHAMAKNQSIKTSGGPSDQTIFSLPQSSLELAGPNTLPTSTGDALYPREGYMANSINKLPQLSIKNVKEKAIIQTQDSTVQIKAGTSEKIELPPITLDLLVRETTLINNPSVDVPGKEFDNLKRYNDRLVEKTATPKITVRNHGNVEFHELPNRMGVTQ